MREYIRGNKILLAVLLVVFVVCFFVIGARYAAESRNKTYDIVLDYSEIAAMAIQTEHDVSWWLGKFKDMKITKVGLAEENLMSLMDDTDIRLTSTMMDTLTKDAEWQSRYPREFVDKLNENGYVPFDLLVEIEGSDTVSFVLDAVSGRFDPESYYTYMSDTGDKAYILMRGSADVTLYSQNYKYMNSVGSGFTDKSDIKSSKIMYISLGLSPDKVKLISGLGMEIIPRTMSYSGKNGTRYGKAVIEGYAKYGIVPSYMIVGGEAVIGFDDGISLAEDYILNNDITVGLIENTTQRQNIMQAGVVEIAEKSGFNAVRVFSVWNYIQNRYQYYGYEGAEEIENTLFRAVTERNIRVIYFKPILRFKDLHTYVTDVSVYEKMFQNLEKRLDEHGIHYASASIIAGYEVSRIFKVIFGIGTAIAAVLLLRNIFALREKTAVILAVLGTLAVLAAFFVMPNTSELVASLAAAIVFGCLAITCFTAAGKKYSDMLPQNASIFKILKYGMGTLILSVVIAFFGGMLTAAPISSIHYMLELDIFRGVKVGQLLPLAYFIAVYLAYFGYKNQKNVGGKLEMRDIKALLNTDIKVWMLFLACVVGGLGVYYILRTGHDSSIGASSYEMLFRNELENILIARPRNKEFLFAFPCVMLMVYAAIRQIRIWPVLFGLGGAIGMTSVINTFEHIRTPLYLGFIRTAYSLLFGIIVGAVMVLLVEAVYRLYNKFLKKYFCEAENV